MTTPYTLPHAVYTAYNETTKLYTDTQMQAAFTAGAASRDTAYMEGYECAKHEVRDAFHAEIEALRADAARLNFLIDNRAYVGSDQTCGDGYWLKFIQLDGTTWVQITDHETPRAAIDAAIAAEGGKT